jgi:hypothetical protein
MSKTPGQRRGRSSADKWRSGRGWGKILTLASSPGTLCGLRCRPRIGIKCRGGQTRGARSLSGSPDLSPHRAPLGQVVSQVPALRRGAACHASAAGMAATIRAATRSACHEPSASYRTRAVSASRLDAAPESAVALQCSAGHPPAESAFGISKRREDNEGNSRHQGDARCAGV